MLGILHSYLLLHKNGALWHVINIRLTYFYYSLKLFLDLFLFLSLPLFFSPLPSFFSLPIFPSSLFSAFAFTVLFWKALPVFPFADIFLGCWWDVDGMLMLTWSSVATFLVNFDCRFWTKTHLISLKNAHGPHVILLLFWMLLRGRLTCLFSLSPMLLLSFASDVVVSF